MANQDSREHHSGSSLNALTVGALGVVFGDIGTSPLYALREAFHGEYAVHVTERHVLGVLSLILWALILVVSVKYLLFVMRADNRGEGGVLALTALAAPPRLQRRYVRSRRILLIGLFGAALLFGDGVITPAITVLSAVEGLEVITPLFQPYVVPLTLIILAGLFFAQRQGTALIGAIFGPVIVLWFLVIGALGINGIIDNPTILRAVSPFYAIDFFVHSGRSGLIVLGAVFLAVTGAEALYADMGHFGRRPIQRGWFYVALPGIALNYFGQGALILRDPSTVENPFFLLAPAWCLYPLVGLATAAAVIASQALISGVFSLTRQAIQLGYSPRIRIVHTSSMEIGQIYVPLVNWVLLAATCWLVLEFKSSRELAAAYGIAVSTTMVITTVLAYTVARQVWRWRRAKALTILIFMISLDLVFFGANLLKIKDGGWVPLVMGMVVFVFMTTWRRGRTILSDRLREKHVPFQKFTQQLQTHPPVHVPGTAFFLTGDPDGTPPALLHNVLHNKVLHHNNVLLTIITEDVPHVPREERVQTVVLGREFYRVTAHYGFMETPDINDILRNCAERGVEFKVNEITFFLGRETLLPSSRHGMALWRESLFSIMSKNAERATAYFNIPPNQVVEIGLQIEL